MKTDYDTALKIIEEYVQSIGYDNLNSFNEYHHIDTEEHRCAVEAVTSYLGDLQRQGKLLNWN